MFHVYAIYMLSHLIRRNKSERELKSVLWCWGWGVRRPCLPLLWGITCAITRFFANTMHNKAVHNTAGRHCLCFIWNPETSETPNHILLSSAASNRFRVKLSGTAEFSVRFYSLFSLFVCDTEFLSSTFFTLLLQLWNRYFQHFLLETGDKEKVNPWKSFQILPDKSAFSEQANPNQFYSDSHCHLLAKRDGRSDVYVWICHSAFKKMF